MRGDRAAVLAREVYIELRRPELRPQLAQEERDNHSAQRARNGDDADRTADHTKPESAPARCHDPQRDLASAIAVSTHDSMFRAMVLYGS